MEGNRAKNLKSGCVFQSNIELQVRCPILYKGRVRRAQACVLPTTSTHNFGSSVVGRRAAIAPLPQNTWMQEKKVNGALAPS